MMSIRSLADFNGSSPGGAVTGWHRHRHRPGLKLPADTTNEGWGLLTGHQQGLRSGRTRGLSHGHGHLNYGLAEPSRTDVGGQHPHDHSHPTRKRPAGPIKILIEAPMRG